MAGITKYQKLQKAKSKFCEGKTTKTELNKVAADYIKDATTKGKTKTEAEKSANRVLNRGCAISGVKAKKKTVKAKAAPKKRTVKKKK
jgi:hypothetical protein